jgi:small ligand-binding sensory domain FIST
MPMPLVTGAGLSTVPDPIAATEAACAEARSHMGDASVDLAVVFFSAWHAEAAVDMVGVIHSSLEPRALLGASAQAIIGGAREIEDRPAVSVWAAHLEQTNVLTFGLEYEQGSEGGMFLGFPEVVPDGATALILADPFTFPADQLLQRFNSDRPGLQVIGGMASGSPAPGQTRLVVDTEVRNGGAVGALIEGHVKVRPLVSQGCRPIGEPATITNADRNVILELGGRAPLERVRETFSAASPDERAMMQQGLHIGRVIDEYKTEFRRGDFLIRGVLGADPETGAIAVGDRVGIGETVQLHVRDAASADEDLREMLSAVERRPSGALLFTCNGRGMNMFGAPDHDAQAVQQGFGGIPLAGFFCAGELGPVGGKNFLHGFTASMALFVED